MLAAEVVAHHAGKKLAFGDWEGNDAGRSWARELRQLLETRDIDAALVEVDEPLSEVTIEEVMTPSIQMPPSLPAPRPPLKKPKLVSVIDGEDSDDSLTGYASPTSSRSASPTPSELDEIEKDPTVHVGVKKVLRPVYLAQLGEMVRGTSVTKDANQEADKTEMALNYGEELIRKKRTYGTELGSSSLPCPCHLTTFP
jgi:telomere length regulation protein